jgi:hypothetical protein
MFNYTKLIPNSEIFTCGAKFVNVRGKTIVYTQVQTAGDTIKVTRQNPTQCLHNVQKA